MKNRAYLHVVRFSIIFVIVSFVFLTSGFAKIRPNTVFQSVQGVPCVISESVKDIPADALVLQIEPEDTEAAEAVETVETEAAPETETVPETEAVSETESESESEPAPETEAVQETEAVSDTEATPETEAESETEVIPETEAESETEMRYVGINVPLPTTPPTRTAYDYSSPVPESDPVSDDYFASSLFIGDSRTVGLYNYTGVIGNCYAKVGLSIKNVLSTAFVEMPSDNGIETVTVIDAIKKNADQFSQVYICFGLNELGWVSSQAFINTYDYVIDQIRELLPDMPIYVQAIIPVTQAVSDENPNGVNNDRIAEYNRLIAEMAYENSVFYLETTEVFCSEGGYVLDPAQSFDGIHLNRDASLSLLEYLRIHTVERIK